MTTANSMQIVLAALFLVAGCSDYGDDERQREVLDASRDYYSIAQMHRAEYRGVTGQGERENPTTLQDQIAASSVLLVCERLESNCEYHSGLCGSCAEKENPEDNAVFLPCVAWCEANIEYCRLETVCWDLYFDGTSDRKF